MLFLTPPYVVNSPGPTVDTLGEVDDEPLITIAGEETNDTGGELRLTTVSTVGGPGFPVTTVQVLQGWAAGTSTVLPREAVYSEGETREDVKEETSAEMTSSQTAASVAALTELGYEVPTELTVAGTAEDGAARGVLQEDDTLKWIEVAGERTETTDFATLSDVLGQTPPGSEVTLGVLRGSHEEALDLTTTGDGEGGSLLGVFLATDADLPVAIDFAIEDIGGPSAGSMFALGIIDLLSPGPLSGEEDVAGTGTISLDGEIGAIGGIRQKMAGASRDGATWFLAPTGNCSEVVGHVPGGLDVVAIDTLSEARQAVEHIADGDTADLATCEAAVAEATP